MSRSHSDVGGYRGRRTVTDILRLIAIVLAVAVVLVVAGLFFLQQYIVYTDEGPKLQLPSLFQREEGPDGSVSVPEPGSLSIIEDEPSGSQSEPDQGQAEADNDQRPPADALRQDRQQPPLPLPGGDSPGEPGVGGE